MAGREPDRSQEDLSRRRIAPVLVAAVPVALLFYAVAVEPYAVERHDLGVAIRDLPPAFEGYRILHLSDFEATAPGPREERVTEIAREARPDLVLVTGDLSRKSLVGGRKWRAIRRMAASFETVTRRSRSSVLKPRCVGLGEARR